MNNGRENKGIEIGSILLGFIAVFVLGVILRELRVVLVPFSVALLLSFVFRPIVVRLKKKGVPTFPVMLIVLLILASTLWLVYISIVPSLASFATQFTEYLGGIRELGSDMEDQFKETIAGYGFNAEDLSIVGLIDFPAVTSMVTGGVGSFLNFFSNTFLVGLFMLFILAGSGQLDAKIELAFSRDTDDKSLEASNISVMMKKILDPARRFLGVKTNEILVADRGQVVEEVRKVDQKTDQRADQIKKVIKKIIDDVQGYLLVKTIASVITGALIFLVLWSFDIKFAVLWGFIAFLLNYIPNIGSFAAVVLPFGQSALQAAGGEITWPIAFVVLGLMVGVEMLVGNVIDPQITGDILDISPLLILVSLFFWGWLWGIVGMILAVPLTSMIKIIFYNVPPLRPVAILMGRPKFKKKPQEEK